MLFLDDKQVQKITNNLLQHKSKVPQAEICVNRTHEVSSKRQGQLKHCIYTTKYWLHAYEIRNRVFPKRLTNGGTFNNMLLFENKKYCFPYCFLKIFIRGTTP